MLGIGNIGQVSKVKSARRLVRFEHDIDAVPLAGFAERSACEKKVEVRIMVDFSAWSLGLASRHVELLGISILAPLR